MNVKRLVIGGLLGGAVAGLALWAFLPRPVPVETAPVSAGRFIATVEESGRTRVRERYTLSSPLVARLARPTLRAGDPVEIGQSVAVLRASASPLLDARTREDLEQRLGMAEAALEEAAAAQERARILLAKAETDLDRTRRLRSTGAATPAQLDRDTANVAAAERDLVAADRRRHAAEHAVQQIRVLMQPATSAAGETVTITAPASGRVLRMIQESEAVVAAGAPLLEIGNLRDMEVIVDLLTTMAVRVREGAPVAISSWGGSPPLAGRVRRVEPSGFTKLSALGVEEQRVWVVIEIIAPPDNWPGLGDGFRVDVTITLEEVEAATLIPAGALFRRGDDWFVFVLADGRARLRRVVVQHRSGRVAAVASGVGEGERVIVYPPSAVTDGRSARSL
jgi:HlyD family secretion protein